jgi:Restriction Endonuclease associating with ARP
MNPPAMNIQTTRSFWWNDLKSERGPKECPVKGCENKSADICEEHGLKIHRTTFVYFNGISPQERCRAQLRNFLLGGRGFLRDHILQNRNKAETHRLGNEKSEDALTWNVFGELHRRGLLHLAYAYVTGENAGPGQVRLFLWGLEIDFAGNNAIQCQYLTEVRKNLEHGVRRFFTEPDVMLLGPDRLVLIEAKFTSGNTVCVDGKDADGEKPRSRDGLIRTYIEENKLWQPVLCRQDLDEKVHSQLLRMIVFASTMAQMMKKGWKVVNLVSRTQWEQWHERAQATGYDYRDPTECIPSRVRGHFQFLYWEDLFRAILANDDRVAEIAEYMRRKSANLAPAFKFS